LVQIYRIIQPNFDCGIIAGVAGRGGMGGGLNFCGTGIEIFQNLRLYPISKKRFVIAFGPSPFD